MSRPALGVGLVYWPVLAPLFEAGNDTVGILELEPETLWEKVAPRPDHWRYRVNESLMAQVAGLTQAKLVHGIGHPLGGSVADPVEHLSLLAGVVDQLDPAWVSEHLSFNRVRTPRAVQEVGFLLPPAQTAAGVGVAAGNIRNRQRVLRRPVAFETGVNYLRPRAAEMDDGTFFGAVALAADAGILLDLHNLWCNERNGRQRVSDVLEQLPLDRVWEVHLAGGMPLAGYWLDAHSGLVPEPLMELAADVMARLSNVGALLFEILPEHVPTVGLDGVHRQLVALRQLWDLRPSRTVRVPVQPHRQSAEQPDSRDVAAVAAWETALVGALGVPSPGESALAGTLRGDPGIPIFRQLIGDARRGFLARTMRYTTTALLAGLGGQQTRELLDSYLASSPPDAYAAVEAHQFACFLSERPHVLRRVPYLAEVLEFEHGLVRATIFGQDSELHWTADPTAILGALDDGDLPPQLPPAHTRMRIAASAPSRDSRS
ncbi:MAG: DUF692 family multinuclear iron-containing protein [Mycobacteriales bacterium]